MFLFWKKKKNASTIDIEKLVGRLHYILDANQQATDKVHAAHIREFFNEDGSAKMMRCKTSDSTAMEIPLHTLINHSHLHLCELKLSIPVSPDSLNLSADVHNNDTLTGRYMATIQKKGDAKGAVMLEVKFLLKESQVRE